MNATFKTTRQAETIGAFGRHDDGSMVVPIHRDDPWRGKTVFMRALVRTQNRILKGEPGGTFEPYYGEDHNPYIEHCVTCKCSFDDGIFSTPNFDWYTSLCHYVDVHNYQPSEAFIVFVMKYAAEGFVLPPKRRRRPVSANEKLLRAVAAAETTKSTDRAHVQDVLQVFRNYFHATLDCLSGGLPAGQAVEEIRKARLDFRRDWQALGLPDIDWSWDSRL